MLIKSSQLLSSGSQFSAIMTISVMVQCLAVCLLALQVMPCCLHFIWREATIDARGKAFWRFVCASSRSSSQLSSLCMNQAGLCEDSLGVKIKTPPRKAPRSQRPSRQWRHPLEAPMIVKNTETPICRCLVARASSLSALCGNASRLHHVLLFLNVACQRARNVD